MVSKDIFMFLDETGTDKESNLLAIACITTHDPDYLRSKLETLKNEILSDPIRSRIPSVQKSLSKKGFHYCEDDTTDVKAHVINLISLLPFKAYICYQEKESDFNPSQGYDWYDKLFGRVMFERLRANRDVPIHICFEQHDNRIENPVLANLVCKELDQDFARLAQEYNCSYSRYADDITFSGDQTPRKKDIVKCLKEYEFELNPAKWKHQCRGRSQYVTGLTVFDNTKPRIPKFIKKQLRQILYYASKYGWDNHKSKVNSCNHKNMHYEIKRINGLIAFMYSVEPDRALQFDLQWQKFSKKKVFLMKTNVTPMLFLHVILLCKKQVKEVRSLSSR